MRYTLYVRNSPRGSWMSYANASLQYDEQRGGVVNQDGILYTMDPQPIKDGILIGHEAGTYIAIPETHFAYNMILFYKINNECLENVDDRNKLWTFLDNTLRKIVIV